MSQRRKPKSEASNTVSSTFSKPHCLSWTLRHKALILPLLLTNLVAETAAARPSRNGPEATGTRSRPLPLAVILVSKQDGKNGKTLADAVSGQLSSLPVRLQILWLDRLPDRLTDQVRRAAHAAKQTSAQAVFWADLRAGRQIFLYLTNQAGSRILVRTISPKTTNQADRILATALVVESSMRVLISGGRTGLHRQQPPPPAARQQPASEWLEIDMSYGLMPLSAEPGLNEHGTAAEPGLSVHSSAPTGGLQRRRCPRHRGHPPAQGPTPYPAPDQDGPGHRRPRSPMSRGNHGKPATISWRLEPCHLG